MDDPPPTQGSIEDLGFQTEAEAAEVFQQQSPNDPYVVTSTLNDYVSNADLAVTITRGTTFPNAPFDGDEHYLTEDIYPAGTVFNPTPTIVSRRASGTGNQILMQTTVSDPVSNETIVAGTTLVQQNNVPVITSSRISLTGGAGRNYQRGFVRDRSFNGRHETRSSTVGTTIITTTVSEVQYRDVTTVAPGGGNRLTLVDATLHDFHYQQVTRNRAGSAIIQNLHYIVIRTPTGDINPYPAANSAITAIEGYIQDNSTLWIDLIQGSATPIDFTSTAQLPTGSYDVMGDLGTRREETTYQFFPYNGFAITQATINAVTITPDASGNVDIVQNDDVRPWSVTFSRSFDGVPSSPTTPNFVPGLFIRQDGSWNRVDYTTANGASGVATEEVEVRTDNLTLFVPASTIAAGFGALPANSGTAGWIHTIQVNGVDALRIDASAIPHTSDADYEFNYTALGDWTLTSATRDTTSSGLTYNGRDLYISISGDNEIYATNARIEIFKQLVADATNFTDFKNMIARL